MNMPLQVLVIEDSITDMALVLRQLKRQGYQPAYRRVETAAELRDALAAAWDLVLADYSMPGFGAMEALAIVQATGLDIPVIIVSGTISPDVAVAAMRAGAKDFMPKDDLTRLGPAIARELREAQERHARRRAEAALQDSERKFRTLIEKSFDGTVLVDATGHALYVSPAVCRMLGFDEAELLGTGPMAVAHPDDLGLIGESLATLLDDPRSDVRLVFRLRHKDGSFRWMEGIATNLLADPTVSAIVLHLRDVTEQRAAATMRDRLAAIVASSDDAIIGVTTAGLIESWNPGATRLYGYTAEEAIGRPVLMLAPPDYLDEIPMLLESVHQGRGVAQFESVRLKKTGERVHVSISLSPVRDDSGRIVSSASITRDITPRKQAEQEIRFQAGLLGAVGQAVIAIDLAGIVIYWNRAAEDLYGWAAGEALGRNLATILISPDDVKQGQKLLARVHAGATWTGEFTVRHRDGHPIPVLATDVPILDGSGTVLGIIGVSVDISDRVRAEEALRQSEQRFKALSEHATDMVSIIGMDSIIQYASPSYERLLGYPPNLVIGQRALTIVHPDDADLVGQQMSTLAEPGTIATAEYRLKHADGSWRTVETTAINRMDEPAVAGIVATTHDVTERAHALEEQRQARQAAEHARASADALALLRSDFVAAVSHELRTPLTAVIGYAELLKAHWSRMTEDQRKDRVLRIAQAADRQKRLVEDLLTLTNMNHTPLPLHVVSMSVAALVRQAAHDVSMAYADQRIETEGSEPHVEARADPDRATQVLTNLIDNAAKYSPEGSPIHISWHEDAGSAIIQVRDHGSGIPASGREQLFTQFGRIPGSRIRAGHVGTGLGLYLGRQFARAMDGELDLLETGPQGSTFCFRLPLAFS
jgi:two-component system cell cycle sensor histidine kinase/response regulator CckA